MNMYVYMYIYIYIYIFIYLCVYVEIVCVYMYIPEWVADLGLQGNASAPLNGFGVDIRQL